MLEICKSCPLYQYHNGLSGYVPPTDNLYNRYALIGESPGDQELAKGIPFIGPSGWEQDRYLSKANLSRDLFHIRNIIQCHPPGNRDPKPMEIECCSAFIIQYLEENRPEIIGTIGRFAARWFLGDELSMEYHHGIPIQINIAGYSPTIVPIYHPAAGMRSTALMTQISQDYMALGRAIRKESSPRVWPSTTTKISCADFAHFPKEIPRVIAIDTETLPDGSPWCLTYCLDSDVYRGRIIMATDHDSLQKLNNLLQSPTVTTVLHNALFDLRVLGDMGVYPSRTHDTMVMAYLLQDLPLGLKPLSYRLISMTMSKYTDMIREASQQKALEYLLEALTMTWPNPEPVLIWEKGYPKIKKPQNISRKINSILNKYSNDPALDITKLWNTIDYSGGRGQVEDVLGAIPEASLADIEFSDALDYACSDAVATYKVYPILRERITEMDLWDTFDRDMRMIPVVADMMETGILIDKARLQSLDSALDELKSVVDAQINELYTGDGWLNPGSTQQVSKALYSMGVYKMSGLSTNSTTLDLYRDKHPIVNLITRWRELSKLQSTYLRPLPTKADSNNRIHTRFSNTNTTTGRLSSSKPNLQNIPTRTDEGKQIRYAFIASPGCVLVSLDYSQVEMRCIAHMSGDPTMIQMFLDDLDIHSETAARMWQISVDQVDRNKHRRPAKTTGFGVAYAMGPLGLQSQLRAQGIEKSERECKEFIVSWFGVYPRIYEYMDEVRAEARRNGLVRDFFGRYRLIPEVMSSLPRIVNAGLRQAGNFPIQSMAQQIIKQAMGDLRPIYLEFQEGGRWRCHPLIQIHDELVWDISEEIVEAVVPVIKSVMESAVELVIPTPVDYNIGHSWGDLK